MVVDSYRIHHREGSDSSKSGTGWVLVVERAIRGGGGVMWVVILSLSTIIVDAQLYVWLIYCLLSIAHADGRYMYS
jgi:hypothetical protein